MEYYFKDLASFLKDRHQVTIVEAEGGSEYTDLKKHFNGARIVSIGNKSGLDLPRLKDFLKMRKLFIQSDVVYYHSGAWNIIYCFILQFLTGTPVVGLAWFLTDAYKRFGKQGRSNGDSAKARFATAIFGPSLIRFGTSFKKYQVVSHEDYVFLADYFRNTTKVEEITFGIQTSKYLPCEKPDIFTVLYLARLDYQKGTDRLLELVQRLNSSIDNYNFYIVGNGPLFNTVEKLRATFTNVKYFGYVNKEEEWEKYSHFLCSAHVFISPIRYAGTTIIALESLASGTPVVEFNSNGTNERIKDGINGYKVGSIQEMANKILEIHKKWSEGQGYDELVVNAINSAKNFELSDKFQQVEQFLVEAAVFKRKKIETLNEMDL